MRHSLAGALVAPRSQEIPAIVINKQTFSYPPNYTSFFVLAAKKLGGKL